MSDWHSSIVVPDDAAGLANETTEYRKSQRPTEKAKRRLAVKKRDDRLAIAIAALVGVFSLIAAVLFR